LTRKRLHLFDGFGIELEYMIVDRRTLSVRPIGDHLLRTPSGKVESEIPMGDLKRSNELVLHVLELKTNGPAPSLNGLQQSFQRGVCQMNGMLESLEAVLMPTAMHPWMNPLRETRLWPHAYGEVYKAFDRIFGCRGHGWSNLQSMHVNLPFFDDSEFERLHAAVRPILPLVPAIAASSPIVEGRLTGLMDNRIEFYRHNQEKIPSLSGNIVPEPLYSKKAYQNQLLKKLYQDVAPYDADGVLRYEWINSRGAIARFERNTIEIRLIDMQECPLADLAVAAAVVGLVRLLMNETWVPLERLKRFPTDSLFHLLSESVRSADCARIVDADFLALFGIKAPVTALDLWRRILDSGRFDTLGESFHAPLQIILRDGPLARRIVRALGKSVSPALLKDIYGRLVNCLQTGTLFE